MIRLATRFAAAPGSQPRSTYASGSHVERPQNTSDCRQNTATRSHAMPLRYGNRRGAAGTAGRGPRSTVRRNQLTAATPVTADQRAKGQRQEPSASASGTAVDAATA